MFVTLTSGDLTIRERITPTSGPKLVGDFCTPGVNCATSVSKPILDVVTIVFPGDRRDLEGVAVMKHSRVLGQVKLGVDNAVSVQPGFSPATQERA